MSVDLVVQHAADGPPEADFQKWVSAVHASGMDAEGELTIRIVDEAEALQLNEQWRGKAYATNVLSFPADSNLPAEAGVMLGDLAICAAVVAREAREQGKPELAHWAHLTIHGVLHLLGYDHQEEQEATEMEALEVNILAKLGYPDPYQ